MNFEELLKRAKDVRKNSYSPYSRFKVGAALLCDSGKIYVGTNIENASYGATLCAERSAVSAAVANGENKFTAIAIAGGSDKLEFCPPCGICRQVLAEFADRDFKVILCDESDMKIFNLFDLLPESFSLKR